MMSLGEAANPGVQADSASGIKATATGTNTTGSEAPTTTLTATAPTDSASTPSAATNGQKRPVARRACLSCREKKIKCDGETPQPAGNLRVEQTPSVCSNCRYLGIECVFVASNRGGRRRKRRGSMGDSEFSASSKTDSKLEVVDTTTNTPLGNSHTRNQLDYLHHTNQEFPIRDDNSGGGRSPSLDSRSNESSSASYYGNPLPYNNRSQGEYHHDMYGPPSPPYHHRHHHRYHHRGPPPPPLSHPDAETDHPHHHAYLAGPGSNAFPPPPPPPPPPPHHGMGPFGYGGGAGGRLGAGPGGVPGGGPGFGPPPPPPPPHSRFGYGFPHHHRGRGGGGGGGMGGGRWHHKYAHYQLPPPQALLGDARIASESELSAESHRKLMGGVGGANSQTDASEYRRSSTDSGHMSIDNKKAIITTTNDITGASYYNALLAEVDLPDLKTCCLLIDLYYRYLHASTPVFNDKYDFMRRFSPVRDASLLHSMFAIVASFVPPNVITRAEYRDHTYWFQFVDKYWHTLNTQSTVIGLALLFRYFIGINNVEESLKCIHRILDITELYDLQNVLRFRDAKFYEKLAQVSTGEQLTDRLQLNRLMWITWNHQALYKLSSESTTGPMRFPSEIEFPSESYDTKIFNWEDIQQATATEAELSRLDSFKFLIVVGYMIDEFNRLSTLIDNADFNAKIATLIKISEERLYKVTSLQSSSIILDKRLIVIDSNVLRASFQLQSLKMMNNLPSVSNCFMFKPLNFFNDAHREVNLNFDISDLATNLSKNFDSSNIKNLFKVFKSSLAIIKLLSLGYGSIDGDTSTFPVVVGPTTFKAASDIRDTQRASSFATNTVQQPENWWLHFDDPDLITAIKDSDTPDAWIAYPFWSTQVVSKNTCILASVTLICKFLVFEYSQTEPQQLVAKLFEEPLTQAENESLLNRVPIARPVAKQISLDTEQLEPIPLVEFSLNRLASDLRLCYKFLSCQARYYPAVRDGLAPVEKIVGYVDEVLRTIG